MALVKCCECGGDVSEYAEACPKCGCPIDFIKKNGNNDAIQYNGKVTWSDGVTIDITGIENMIPKENLEESLLFDILSEKFGLDTTDILSVIDVIRFNGYKLPTNFQNTYNDMISENKAKIQAISANTPKCPTCGSTNISKIGTGERVVSVVGLGLLSKKINKSFKCKNCGHTW